MKKTIAGVLSLVVCVSAAYSADRGPVNSIVISQSDTPEDIVAKASCVVPSERQLNALRNEFIAFVHFGPNTFTRMEWGTGMEDPSIFDLHELDTDQWVKALKSAGMKMVILTVKHHDGFVLWQSRYTDHGIMSTPFCEGKGDVLRSLSESCAKYGMKLGVYLSPADLYQIESAGGLYGNGSAKTLRRIPRKVAGRPFADTREFEFVVDDYNEYFLNQLFELLTEYGPIYEVWFDGANPKEKGGQTYDYEAWKTVIRTLAPEAVIFEGGDVRWCGNESGATRLAEFNVRPVPFPAKSDPTVPFEIRGVADRAALAGARELCYRQAETNTSIREGWFYRDDDRQQVRSADDVFDIYERAVGGNSTFLLNVPPNRRGRFSDKDVEVLAETGRRIRDTYGTAVALGSGVAPELTDDDISTAIRVDSVLTVAIAGTSGFNRIMIQEAVGTHGERIEAIEAEVCRGGVWRKIAEAANVGYKRIMRFAEVNGADSLRLRVLSARGVPWIASLSLHRYDSRPPRLSAERSASGLVSIFPKKDDFQWKPSGINSAAMLSDGMEIRFTLDGSEPDTLSPIYSAPFDAGACELRAVAFLGGRQGPELREQLMIPDVTVVAESPLTLDLGKDTDVRGFCYAPAADRRPDSLVGSALVEVSDDGKHWTEAATLVHGNIVNDPSRRLHFLDAVVTTRYVRVVALSAAAAGDIIKPEIKACEFGVF